MKIFFKLDAVPAKSSFKFVALNISFSMSELATKPSEGDCSAIIDWINCCWSVRRLEPVLPILLNELEMFFTLRKATGLANSVRLFLCYS